MSQRVSQRVFVGTLPIRCFLVFCSGLKTIMKHLGGLVKRFRCTIHNKALYKCTIHSLRYFLSNFHYLFFIVCFSIFTTYHTTVSNFWVKSVVYLLIFHVNLILDMFVVTIIV